ncbi:MAG: hypothetical protein ACRCYZ_03195 [Alphaproteobacteria bacterium]
MKNKGCLRFQALCLIFSGLMLQNKAIAEAEVGVNAVYKFKDGTKPFTLYKEPYVEPSNPVETPKPKEKPMEIGRPEPINKPASNPQPNNTEKARVESFRKKTPRLTRKKPPRPTIIDPAVFEEPPKSTTPEPTSSLFNFENLGFIQPAFAKKSDQAEQITPDKPYPLPHKVSWNQGVVPFQKKRSFLVKTIPSNGLCEEGFTPIEIQELDSKQPVKQRCVKQGEYVLIEVSKDEGLTVLNGKSAPIWKEKGIKFQTRDKEYLEEKMQQELEEIEKKYAKEREILEQRYQSEVLNLKARYNNAF